MVSGPTPALAAGQGDADPLTTRRPLSTGATLRLTYHDVWAALRSLLRAREARTP